MNLKKGLMTTVGVVGLAIVSIWEVVKLPFRLIGFLWRHKLATALVAATAWFGIGELRTQQERRAYNRACVQKMIETERNKPKPSSAVLPKSKTTSVTPKKTKETPVQGDFSMAPIGSYRYDLAADAVMKKPLTDGMVAAPVQVREIKERREGLSGRISKTVITKTVEDKIETMITDGVTLSAFETMDTQMILDRLKYKSDRFGACTIAVCQATNVQNAAVVRIGYLSRPDKGTGEFQVYRSDFVSDRGYSPVTEDINIAFKGTNIRFGLHFDEQGVRQVNFVKGKPTVLIDAQDDRELWVVRDGHLEREKDQRMVNIVLAQFATNRPAKAYVQAFSEPRIKSRRNKDYNL